MYAYAYVVYDLLVVFNPRCTYVSMYCILLYLVHTYIGMQAQPASHIQRMHDVVAYRYRQCCIVDTLYNSLQKMTVAAFKKMLYDVMGIKPEHQNLIPAKKNTERWNQTW